MRDEAEERRGLRANIVASKGLFKYVLKDKRWRRLRFRNDSVAALVEVTSGKG
jgi:hypothetical protein